MRYRSVTLVIPKAISRWAKRLAMEQGTSFSGLFSRFPIECTLEDRE